MDAIMMWFAPPAFDGNEEKRRQSRLIMFSVAGFLAIAGMFLCTAFIEHRALTGPGVVNALAIMSMFLVHHWMHQDRLELAKVWLLAVMFVCVTVNIASLGSIRTPWAAIYLPGVIISGLLLDRNGIAYSTTACSLALLGLIIAENTGLLPAPDLTVGVPQWLTYTALCGFTGRLICTANQVTKDALARAEQELETRTRTESSLNSTNQKLSTRVMEVEALHRELREQAQHDELTGLCNRRYLNDAVGREIARARRDMDSLSFVMLDIDHFKDVNDNYGHQAGDEVLVQIARLLATCARVSDIACRHGGEEFLLVLPGTDLDFAQRRAEEVRQKCELHDFQVEGTTLKITLSFGVAAYPEHGSNWEEIVSKADQAMYQSKHDGRNRVTTWHDPKTLH